MSCAVLLNIIHFCTFDMHHDLHVPLTCCNVVVGGCQSVISALKCGCFLEGCYGYFRGFLAKWKKNIKLYIYNTLVSLNMVISYIYIIKKKEQCFRPGREKNSLFVHLFVCSLVHLFLPSFLHPSSQSVSLHGSIKNHNYVLNIHYYFCTLYLCMYVFVFSFVWGYVLYI